MTPGSVADGQSNCPRRVPLLDGGGGSCGGSDDNEDEEEKDNNMN